MDETADSRQKQRLFAADGWAARARELAVWACERLVNRVDVWGAYIPESERGKEYRRADGQVERLGKTLTRPGVKQRGKVFLTPAHLERHFRASGAEDVVGLHTTSPNNTSLWGAVELDRHGEPGNSPGANLAAVLAWYGRLWEMGFRSLLLTDSNGAGGYHLRVLFSESVPTPRVFAFLRWLTADHARHGLPAQPETFPKQARVTASGPGSLGNWLRLPGRHHTREHWSCVWDGSRWMNGEAAVAQILALTGDAPGLIPSALPTPGPSPRPTTPGRRLLAGGAEDGKLARRIFGYLARLPNLGEGQGRDDIAYHFACWLVRDLALSDETALVWLDRWDQGNSPPKGTDRLCEILADAHKYGRRAYGSGLNAPLQKPRGKHHHTVLTATVEVW